MPNTTKESNATMKEILDYLKWHWLENDKYEDIYIDWEKVLWISIWDQYEHFIPTLLSFNDLLFDESSNACEIIAKKFKEPLIEFMPDPYEGFHSWQCNICCDHFYCEDEIKNHKCNDRIDYVYEWIEYNDNLGVQDLETKEFKKLSKQDFKEIMRENLMEKDYENIENFWTLVKKKLAPLTNEQRIYKIKERLGLE